MKTFQTHFTNGKGQRVVRSTTVIYPNGGYLHIDNYIMPLDFSRHLGAVPPPSQRTKTRRVAKDEKIPIAGTGETK